ncbi:non-specific lipid transfer protein GPI-anchored 5-like [Oryza glaberrima]|uniref:Bifunctional inhibitor/plant lipid transfer protein/seed storage helical domain-containing protein n=1 Tax=Oryza glaberrima TaxID=4538 RepID=I1Q8G5_ORYGL|nr:non-specific lipid transfer protein GPI-anchored 5-like [Oryza glaberrima]
MARNNGVAVMFAAVVVVAGALVAGAAAQSGCTSEMVSLAPCLDYMQGNASRPTASCCAALSSVVKSRPECLCAVLGGGASSLGVTVNTTRALELPAACSVKTPPPSECSKVGAPIPSPAPGGAAAPNAPPAAGTGSKTTPTTGASSAGESVGKAASVAMVIVSAAFAMLYA